jgi:uncharacterized protein
MLENLAHVHPDQWTKPFWDATARHELVCQACLDCGSTRMPPTPFCWKCRSRNCEYRKLPGTGTVFTYSTTTFTASPSTISKEELPYTVVVVELDGSDGCKLIGALVPSDSAAPEIGRSVEVRWQDTDEGAAIPRFQLV